MYSLSYKFVLKNNNAFWLFHTEHFGLCNKRIYQFSVMDLKSNFREKTSTQAGHLLSQITIELCQERLPAKSFELTSMKYGSTANGHDGVVTRRSNFENNGKNGNFNLTNFGNLLNHTSGWVFTKLLKSNS